MRSVARVGLGIFCVSVFGGIFSNQSPSAIAQCVQADVSVQYNISGSRQPTNRTNDVDMQSDPGCVGNTSVTTGIQGNVGGNGPVEQHRQVRHRQTGGNPYGLPGNTVQIKSNVGVDVYNPADNIKY
jgi:hypothetical protein